MSREELQIEENIIAYEVKTEFETKKLLELLKKSKSLSYENLNLELLENQKTFFIKNFPLEEIKNIKKNSNNNDNILEMLNHIFDNFDETTIQNLENYKSDFLGIIPPIILKKQKNNYKILDGNKRTILSKEILKINSIPAFIII